MAAFKAKQDDLRRLMKERRENLKNRIDSPFAKYNSSGQLSCAICCIQISSNALWAPHVASKIHKENALKKRKGTIDASQNRVPPPVNEERPANGVPSINEKRSEVQPPSVKKLKRDAEQMPPPKSIPVKSNNKLALLDTYSSSSDEEDSAPMEVSSTPNNVLPKDFFDAAPTSSIPINQEDQVDKDEQKSVAVATNSVEALPEGFFDDPVLDAKARNIEYKDPVEEEWERYQKAIAEETSVSKTIIEEDLEESVLERDISEIDQQINLWEKAEMLRKKAEEARSKMPVSVEKKDSSSSTDDEDLDEDDLLDWRSKGVRKK